MIVKGHRVYRGHRSAGHSGLPVLLTILVLILLALLLTFSPVSYTHLTLPTKA